MYKSKSQSMQRGSDHRQNRVLITNQDLYKNVSPALASREIVNFDFGSMDVTAFVRKMTPIIKSLAKNGIRKPQDVSRSLNKRGLLTACGGKWSPRLAWFLLGLVFDGKVPQMANGKVLLNVGSDQPSDWIKTEVRSVKSVASKDAQTVAKSVLSAPLTTEELAQRLGVLGRVQRKPA